MFYKNARIFCPDFQFRTGAFEVKDGKFGAAGVCILAGFVVKYIQSIYKQQT